MIFQGDELEPSAGRILLFEAGKQRSKLVEARGPVLTLKLVHTVEASVGAITCIDGVLVVAMSCMASTSHSCAYVYVWPDEHVSYMCSSVYTASKITKTMMTTSVSS